MPDRLNRKPKLNTLHDWLSDLDPVTDEDYAAAYLNGENRGDLEPNSGSGPETQNEASQTPIDDGTTALEDEKVKRDFSGDAAEKGLEPHSPSEEENGKQSQSQAIAHPEPEVQTGASRMAARLDQPEIEGPDFNQLRSTAIQDYESDFHEEQEVDRSTITRLRKWYNQLLPMRKVDMLLGMLITIGLGILLIIFLASRTPQAPAATPDLALDPSIPIPVMVILPDGQSFYLGVGNITNGSWNPQAAEWLAGSEVPRWLSLPWNAQLESLVRAYEVDTPIQLQMSNKDVLVYRFQAIQEIPAEELSSFHANTPDLLIVLSKPGASTRLVMIAVH